MNDHHVAAHCARLAAGCLLRMRAGSGLAGRELGDAGDAAAQRVLAEALTEWRPGDAVLSEESTDDPVRLTADRVWIVDPLDGTREYTELGRTDWAVHVALWERGELTAGAVALPANGIVLSTSDIPPPGRPLDGKPRIVVSRTRAPEFVSRLAEALDAVLLPMGSAGAKASAVVRGEADVYVHGGGQYEWDSAAPVAVARRYGLHTSRLDGTPLAYNQPNPYLPDLLVCRQDLAALVLAALASG
ncbi:3'(2'),5'-bisphosphate nucleotidase CysQ [Actinocrispum sp. NPDC049592]|uniref:3'(2'),5'-bisphosphate nucleotidase CysQ n=1 Tax=Actinocrispum sp. NPDC049592 TaxID=3154835 RepID=UPI003429ABA0